MAEHTDDPQRRIIPFSKRRVNPEIVYLFVTPEDDPPQASPLQGISYGIAVLADAVRLIVELPADVLEPALPHSANRTSSKRYLFMGMGTHDH
jgi:hypothetical protein